MSGMSPWAMLGSARRDRSVVEQKLSRDTVKRVVGFALPHRALIAGFLFFVVIDAALVVVNPLLIKHLLDDGILAKDTSVVVWLARRDGAWSRSSTPPSGSPPATCPPASARA